MEYKLIIATLIIGALSNYLGYSDAMDKLDELIITKRWKFWRGVAVVSGAFIISCLIAISTNIVDYWTYSKLFASIASLSSQWKMILLVWVYLWNIYWIMFDLSMNLFSKEDWDYISDNGKDHNDSIFDKAFHFIDRKYSGKVQAAVKLLILACTLILIF